VAASPGACRWAAQAATGRRQRPLRGAGAPPGPGGGAPPRRQVLIGGGQEASQVTTTSSRAGKFESRFFHKARLATAGCLA